MIYLLLILFRFDGTSAVSRVEFFDPRVGKWGVVNSMSRARGAVAVGAVGASIFTCGGSEGRNSAPSDV